MTWEKYAIHCILHGQTCSVFVQMQVYNMRQVQQDIQAVEATGLFQKVQLLPRTSETSSLEYPGLDLTLYVTEPPKYGGVNAGFGISLQVSHSMTRVFVMKVVVCI